jgi:hypothetical protein
MDTSSLEHVNKTEKLHSYFGINSIIDIIVAKVKEIPQFERLNRSIDLVLLICTQIENLIKDNKVVGEKGFKLDIACKVFEKLGFLKPDDKDFLVNSVNYLHSSGGIKEVKIINRVVSFVKKFFVKKLIE